MGNKNSTQKPKSSNDIQRKERTNTIAPETKRKSFFHKKKEPEAPKVVPTLESSTPEQKNDPEYVKSFIKENGLLLQHVSSELKNNDEIVNIALEQNPMSIQYTSEKFHGNKELIRKLIQQNIKILKFASKEIKSDKNFIIEAIKLEPEAIDYAANELRRDITLLEEVKKNWKGVVLPLTIQNDKKNAFTCIKKLKWNIFYYINEDLRNDREIALTTISENWKEFQYCSPDLQKNKEIVLEVLKRSVNDKDGSPIALSEELKEDKEFIIQAYKINPFIFKYVLSLQNDKTIALEVFSKDGLSLESASDVLKDDFEVVKCAIQQNSLAYQFASSKLKENEELIILAVKENGNVLKYVPDKCKTKNVILEAKIRFDETLDYIPKDILSQDKEFILKTAEHLESVLLYLSESLSKDKEFIISAIKKNSKCYDNIPREFEKDKDVAIIAAESGVPLQYFRLELRQDQDVIEASKKYQK